MFNGMSMSLSFVTDYKSRYSANLLFFALKIMLMKNDKISHFRQFSTGTLKCMTSFYIAIFCIRDQTSKTILHVIAALTRDKHVSAHVRLYFV